MCFVSTYNQAVPNRDSHTRWPASTTHALLGRLTRSPEWLRPRCDGCIWLPGNGRAVATEVKRLDPTRVTHHSQAARAGGPQCRHSRLDEFDVDSFPAHQANIAGDSEWSPQAATGNSFAPRGSLHRLSGVPQQQARWLSELVRGR